MYKLENNVQWTENLKNAFKHGTTRASISYTDDNSNLVTLNENNALIELTLEDNKYVKDMGFIGSACAKKLEFTIQDANNDYDLENKELTLKIGADYNNSTYYINYGNFIVNEAPQIDETNGKIKVVAYDYMIKFNKPYEDQVNYPVTLLALLQNICTQAGVTLDTTDFNNYDFIVTDNQFQGATLREVLQNIGKCAFSWARIGQDNQLYLDFSQTADEEETLTIDDYKTNGFKKSKDYYGPVNQVTYADSDIEGQEERVYDESSIQQNGLKELVIYDNLFAYTPEKRQQLIAAGTSLFNLTYMPVSQLDSIGFIYLDCNDIISIETLDEQSYNTRIFNHTIKYNGATSDSIETEGTSLNQDAYKNTASNIFQNQQTRIIVDKANKTINSIVEEIGDRSQKTTTITQDIDGIQSLVQDIEDLTVTVTGTRTITLEKCLEGYLLNLNIYGNNVVFDYLYPEDDLYPANDLYPKGDSRIVVTNEDGTSFTYELRITEVLRSNSETYDEYILEDNHAKVIRRVNADGTTKVVPTEEDIGTYTINLKKGTNTITIKNYYANISARYIPENSYTDQFATTAKMTSAITQSATEIMANVTETFETKENAETNYSEIRQTAQEISSEVSRKVGDDEVISKINQSAEAVSIQAQKLNINGVISANGNFKVDTNGNMECKNGKFTGGRVALTGGTYGNANLSISGNNGVNTQILPNEIYIDYNSSGGSGGLYINALNSTSKNAYIYADSDGGGITLGGSNSVTLRAGSTAQIKCYGDMYANNYLYNSKESMKKNISKFDKEALNIIKNGEIYYFNYKKEEDSSKHIGFIIADEGGNYKTPDEVLSSKKDGINSYSMASVMWKAIQEQQEEIENLQKEIKLLKGE
jgi:hypothetical protein